MRGHTPLGDGDTSLEVRCPTGCSVCKRHKLCCPWATHTCPAGQCAGHRRQTHHHGTYLCMYAHLTPERHRKSTIEKIRTRGGPVTGKGFRASWARGGVWTRTLSTWGLGLPSEMEVTHGPAPQGHCWDSWDIRGKPQKASTHLRWPQASPCMCVEGVHVPL